MNNRKLKELGAMFLCLGLMTGCSTQDQITNQKSEVTQNAEAAPIQAIQNEETTSVVGQEKSEDIQSEWIDWHAQQYESIDVTKGSVSISESGIYELTGTLEEGSITVDIDKDVDQGTVYLVFNGVNIHSDVTTPINIIDAEKVVLLLEEGTTNEITQGSIAGVGEDFPSATIYSKADLVIEGNGTLSVKTVYNDAITSRDDLIILGGQIQIEAIQDGLVGKDLLAIKNASIEIKAGKDGMRATNDTESDKGNVIIYSGNIKIEADRDGIQAENSIEIQDGVFEIASGGGYIGVTEVNWGEVQKQLKEEMGMTPEMMPPRNEEEMGMTPEVMPSRDKDAIKEDILIEDNKQDIDKPIPMIPNINNIGTSEEEVTESMKAIKANANITIYDGIFELESYEDTINSKANILIENGNFVINSGEDAIHADGMITINDGNIAIQNGYEGIEAVDIQINGGVIEVNVTDDAINVTEQEGLLEINGGMFTLNAGGDGIDSNGSFTMTDGDVAITIASDGMGGETFVDVDGTISILGGTLVDGTGQVIDPMLMQHKSKEPGVSQGALDRTDKGQGNQTDRVRP